MNGIYLAASKKTLSSAYGVSTETFNKWLKPIEKSVGAYISRCYTPKQVEIIVKHLGLPKHLELVYA